jgi:hypothetical protein
MFVACSGNVRMWLGPAAHAQAARGGGRLRLYGAWCAQCEVGVRGGDDRQVCVQAQEEVTQQLGLRAGCGCQEAHWVLPQHAVVHARRTGGRSSREAHSGASSGAVGCAHSSTALHQLAAAGGRAGAALQLHAERTPLTVVPGANTTVRCVPCVPAMHACEPASLRPCYYRAF